MKNFPHQINKIAKLTAALGVLRKLINSGVNIFDDGVVGDAMARASVRAFRSPTGNMEGLLEAEHAKPRASQGSRTFARDIRRLFELLGFVCSGCLSEEAEVLLEQGSQALDETARSIWREALLRMSLPDSRGRVSHPYRIMLRLVEDMPGLPAYKLGLCLQTADDGEEEYGRIKTLCNQDDQEGLWGAIGVSAHSARNSVKILPALARQLGDIVEIDDGYYPAYVDVRRAPEEPTVEVQIGTPGHKRRIRRDEVAQRAQTPPLGRVARRIYDPDALGRRYTAHERLLYSLLSAIDPPVDCYEGLFDLLAVTQSEVTLFEVKTIRGDEARQVRVGLGQLLYYDHIVVSPMYPKLIIKRCLVTDKVLSADLQSLLRKHEIVPVAYVDGYWTAADLPHVLRQ